MFHRSRPGINFHSRVDRFIEIFQEGNCINAAAKASASIYGLVGPLKVEGPVLQNSGSNFLHPVLVESDVVDGIEAHG